MKRIEFYLPNWQCVCVYDALKDNDRRYGYIYHKPSKTTIMSFKFEKTPMPIEAEQAAFKTMCSSALNSMFMKYHKQTATY